MRHDPSSRWPAGNSYNPYHPKEALTTYIIYSLPAPFSKLRDGIIIELSTKEESLRYEKCRFSFNSVDFVVFVVVDVVDATPLTTWTSLIVILCISSATGACSGRHCDAIPPKFKSNSIRNRDVTWNYLNLLWWWTMHGNLREHKIDMRKCSYCSRDEGRSAFIYFH